MNAVLSHFAFEFRSGIRNRNLLVVNYLFPLVFYLMMGLIMTEINPGFRQALVPAMIVLTVMFSALMGIPDPLVKSREEGIFRTYRINGVPATSILGIAMLTAILHALIVSIIIVISGPLFFDAPLPLDWLNFLLVFIAFALASGGLGILIGVLASSSSMTIMLAQAIFIPSMLLGGLMVPHSMFSGMIAQLARLLPASNAMNAFNALAMGQPASFSAWGSAGALLLSALIAIGLAVAFFRWDRKNASRNGHPLLILLPLLPFALSWLI